MHSDKHACVDCLIFEEWCIDFVRAKWQSDFIDFDVAIKKKETQTKHLLILIE